MKKPLNNWKELREAANLGLRKAARLANISTTHLVQIERGHCNPSANTAVALAQIYQCQVVLARWHSNTYDIREFMESRFVWSSDSGFEFEWFDPGDPGEYEWVIDGDENDHVKQGFFQALNRFTEKDKETG